MQKMKRREKSRPVRKVLCITFCLLFTLLAVFGSFAFAPEQTFTADGTDSTQTVGHLDPAVYNDEPVTSLPPDTPEEDETESSVTESSDIQESSPSPENSNPENDDSDVSSAPENPDPDAAENEEEKGPLFSPLSINQTADSFAVLKGYMETVGADYIIELTKSFPLTSTIYIPDGTNIVLRSSDTTVRKLTMSTLNNAATETRHFVLNGAGSSLTLESNVVLDGTNSVTTAPNAGGITAKANTTFTLSGGTIQNCRTPYDGGILVSTGASFIVNSGLISNCSATQSGGGIYYGPATNMEMKNITIENCVAHTGGGLFVKSSVFTLGPGAVITGCTTVNNPSSEDDDLPSGAGVTVAGGTFQMHGNSKIMNCVSASHAGGIYATANTTVSIGSGADTPLISGCQSQAIGVNGGNGGAINSNSVVYLYSGSIEDCTSVTNGGGVYIDNSSGSLGRLYMSGGSILRCSSPHAGGVFVSAGTSFHMSGGTIGSCESYSNGGGVSIVNGTMTMETGSNVPTIQGCFAGGSGAGGWAGKGGGINATYNSTVLINGGLSDGCEASASGDYRIVGSGGGIYLDKTSEADVLAATISNCKASFYGGGICTVNYDNLTTTENVYFTANSSVAFYRKPADDVTQYTCSDAGSISLVEDQLGAGRLYPLNNYDINYLSYSVFYVGNGGTDNGETEIEVIKGVYPFNDDEYHTISYDFTDPYTVEENDRTLNGHFEHTKQGSKFGMWSDHTIYLPLYEHFKPYPPGSTLYVGKDVFLSTPSMPRVEIFALWTKDVVVTKKVDGDYGDLTKKFDINIRILGAWGDTSFLQENTLSLADGESQTIPDVYESCIMYASEAYAQGYTPTISSGTVGEGEKDPLNNEWISLTDLYGAGDAVVLVTNKFEVAVDSGISFSDVQTALIFVGVTGILLTSYIVVYTNRKRRKQE